MTKIWTSLKFVKKIVAEKNSLKFMLYFSVCGLDVFTWDFSGFSELFMLDSSEGKYLLKYQNIYINKYLNLMKAITSAYYLKALLETQQTYRMENFATIANG